MIRCNSFDYVFSRVCIGTDDLDLARKRCISMKQWLMDECNIFMDTSQIFYYSDLIPDKNKAYLLFLGKTNSLDTLHNEYRQLKINNSEEEIFLLKGVPPNKLKDMIITSVGGLQVDSATYVIFAKEINEFVKRFKKIPQY